MSLEPLHSAVEVAEALGETEYYVKTQCRKKAWPHVRLGRGRVGFTDAHYAEVLALCSVTPEDQPEPRFELAPRSGRRAS